MRDNSSTMFVMRDNSSTMFVMRDNSSTMLWEITLVQCL
jgi:hypothetical protein